MATSKPNPPSPPKKEQEDPPKTPQGRRASSTQELGLEVGFKFHPTDLELVGHYLQRRHSMGHKFHSHGIAECPEFYGQVEPWVIWQAYGGDDSSDDDKILYFFTNRKRMSHTEKRFDRKVGTGTWRSGNIPSQIKDGDRVVGIKRRFRYEGGCDKDHNGAWLMHEYEIDEDLDLVLCSLKKSPRKAPPTSSEEAGGTKRQSLDLESSQKNEEHGSSSTVGCELKNVEQQSTCVEVNVDQEGGVVLYRELDLNRLPHELYATRDDNKNCSFVSNEDDSGHGSNDFSPPLCRMLSQVVQLQEESCEFLDILLDQ